MQKYKICPTCQTKNDVANFLCDVCMADISSIKPFEEKEVKSRVIKLVTNEGDIVINDGDSVGRESVGEEVLYNVGTVSRSHAKFYIKDGEWVVEDLNSTNGIYLNGKKIKKSTLKNNQKLSLSKSFEAKVLIDED